MRLREEMEHYRNVLIVRLKGELDHHTADGLKQRLEDALLRGRATHVVLNLSELAFMDSSGLGVILGRYKTVTARGGKLIVCGVGPAVRRLFELSGLFKIVEECENEHEALGSLEVVS
jgi:stage II sporulation protein AA (anti-sigma F factor antagonist)